jgi:hypothetical protein
MIGITNQASEAELQLSDNTLEMEATLDLFFDLIYMGKAPTFRENHFEEVKTLILLLQKYDCVVQIELFKNSLGRFAPLRQSLLCMCSSSQRIWMTMIRVIHYWRSSQNFVGQRRNQPIGHHLKAAFRAEGYSK